MWFVSLEWGGLETHGKSIVVVLTVICSDVLSKPALQRTAMSVGNE